RLLVFLIRGQGSSSGTIAYGYKRSCTLGFEPFPIQVAHDAYVVFSTHSILIEKNVHISGFTTTSC
ncbi:hypothetical protein U1Q18_037685, partial [Sarracenia purpurea var. burkii]